MNDKQCTDSSSPMLREFLQAFALVFGFASGISLGMFAFTVVIMAALGFVHALRGERLTIEARGATRAKVERVEAWPVED